jgi:hypothetical protein
VEAPKSLRELHFMQRHSVCYNSSGAFGISSKTFLLPNHRIEFYIFKYSSHHPRASFKRSYLDNNLLIGFTGFGSSCPCWIGMDANTYWEGPFLINHDEVNPHDKALDDLYGESHEDGYLTLFWMIYFSHLKGMLLWRTSTSLSQSQDITSG